MFVFTRGDREEAGGRVAVRRNTPPFDTRQKHLRLAESGGNLSPTWYNLIRPGEFSDTPSGGAFFSLAERLNARVFVSAKKLSWSLNCNSQ